MNKERNTFLKAAPLYLVLVMMGLLATMVSQGQTASNTCGFDVGNEYPVDGECVYREFNKPAAFTANLTASGCTGGNYDDAWGWFTATGTSTTVTFDPDNSHRPIMHVYTGACGSLTQVSCHNSGGNGNNAQLVLTTTVGTQYMVRIQRHNTNDGMNGRLCIWSPPSTNACSQIPATEVPVGTTCEFRPFTKPTAYTASMNPSGCSGSNHDDAWGWFTATSTTTAITYDPNSSHRPILHVFTGSCGSLSQVDCFNSGGNGINAELSITTVVGQVYYFRIQRHNTNDAMDGRICIRTPPPFDDCSTPITLPVLENCFAQNFSNVGASLSSQSPDPSCGGTFNANTGRDVWFTFTAPSSGQVIIETTAGTLEAAAMQLYTGGCGSLSAVVCNSNGGTGNMPRIDRTCDPLTPGATYRIRFWGTGGGEGTFTLCVYGPENYTPMFEDCTGAIPVCSDQAINNNASSFGCTQDLNTGNRGCLNSNERQGSWYTFTPSASGTLEFTITPNGDVDYDFAIWGPLSVFACPPSGTPVRCSYASPTNSGSNIGAGTYLTGLAAGNTDTSEPAYNGQVNGFVAPLDVITGEIYVLYIDNFTSNGQSFNLDWTLTNGCSLDCNVLPVELVAIGAEATREHVIVDWETLTEVATSHFVVERSSDGSYFNPIGSLPAAGSSQQRRKYAWTDSDPINGMGYYRLRQVDLDGATKYSEIVTVVYRKGSSSLTLYPNPAKDRIALELPMDGTIESATIILMDASGRILSTAGHTLEQGGNTIDLSIQHLEPGSYLVRAMPSNGKEHAVGRFVKE